MSDKRTNSVKRESPEKLMTRMKNAHHSVPKERLIRHIRTGGVYTVRGHSLRVGDMTPMVNYSPIDNPSIVFSRSVSDVRAKFMMNSAYTLNEENNWPTAPLSETDTQDTNDVSPFEKDTADIMQEIGDRIADMLEQYIKGDWRDTEGRPVGHNSSMIRLKFILLKIVKFRAKWFGMTDTTKDRQ